MTIWLLTTEYPPFYGGGISTYCQNTVRALKEAEAKMTVFLCDKNITGTSISEDNGVRLVRFSPYDHPEKEFLGYETLVSYAFASIIERFVQKEGTPDIIESQEYNGIAYFTLLKKQLLYESFKNLTIVITIHAPAFVCRPYNHEPSFRLPYFWIHEMEKFCLQAADLVISPSRYILNQIDHRFPEFKKSCTIIRNPYHFPVSPLSPHPVKRREFVFYGKASPLKGIFELLKYFRIAWQQDKTLTLRLIGGLDHRYHPSGMLMGEIIKKEYKDYIDAGLLVIEGQIHPGQLKERISSAHAIIFPSRVDNFPYAVMECMAMGKIVLASTTGGHIEMIQPGKNGFLFDLDDPASFAGELQTILDLDETAMEKIGREAASTVGNVCDPALIAGEKMRVFNDLVSNRSPVTRNFPFLREMTPPSTKSSISGIPGMLSVVIPYYNMGKYVKDTVDSILRSDFPDIEIIIFNDGSTDPASIQALEALGSQEKVRIIHGPNGGLPAARNQGASAAKGEFLAFLDPDDTVQPGYYPWAIKLLRQYENVHFVGTWTRYFGDGKGIWPGFTPEPPFLLIHNMANTSSLVYKRWAFLEKGLNDRAMLFGMEDYDSLISMVSHGYNGVVIPEPLFNYRVRKDSMARQFTRAKIEYLYELISHKHKNYYSIFASEINGLLNDNGPGYAYDNPTLDYELRSNPLAKIVGLKILQQLKQNKYLRTYLIKLNQILTKK